MGWDAYAIKDGSWVGSETNGDEALRAEFVAAAAKVRADGYEVDGLLEDAALDCSHCARVMEKAAPYMSAWKDWTVRDVVTTVKTIDWDYVERMIDEDDKWAIPSTRAFLELCAKHGLSIHFSY